MRSQENIAQELFDKIRSRVSNIKLGNDVGEVTTEPKEAKFFEFTFKHRDFPVGAVVLSLNEEGILQVFFPNSMVEDADSSTADAWYGFLKELSRFAARNMINFETKNLTKERLDKKDYQFLTQRNQDEVMETKMYGSKRKSYLEAGQAKIIVQHNKTVDEEKMGSRSRDIKAIYIENSDGERFKFVNNYLPGARAMARHVSNGGITKDDQGAHIVEIMDEMSSLKNFVRTVKSNNYVNEEAQEIIDAATDRYYGLKDTLKSISSAKGYQDYFEHWEPNQVEVEENDLEDLKLKLTRQEYDENITDSLPSVGRALQIKKKMQMENAEALHAMAAGDEKLVVHDNDKRQEIMNYVRMMKNTDMTTDQKNRNIVVNVAEYLANNIVDDATAVAVSKLDFGDSKDQMTAMKLAMKFLKGDVEFKAPKAKKDKFGKAKESSFESYEQTMEMISEGTWQLPSSDQDVNKIEKLMAQTFTLGPDGEYASQAMYDLIGDDTLYDDLYLAGQRNPDGDARPIIKAWLEKYGGGYSKPYDKYMSKLMMNLGIGDKEFGEDTVEEGRLGFSDIEKFGKEMASKIDMEARRRGSADMEPGEADELRYEIAKEMGLVEQDTVDIEDKDASIEMYDDEQDMEEGKMKDMMTGAQELMMKYDEHMGANGDALLDGFIQYQLSSGIPTDAMETGEVDAMKAKHGEAFEDDPMSFLDEMPITKAMFDDIKELTGTDNTEKSAKMLNAVMPNDYVPEAHEESQEVDEVAESIAKLAAMAGVGSNQRSNHGINPGEEGYQITPRSIIAREMRKLQDLEK